LTLEFSQTAALGDGLTDSTEIFAGVESVVGGTAAAVYVCAPYTLANSEFPTHISQKYFSCN
jgi:hypothetical protein